MRPALCFPLQIATKMSYRRAGVQTAISQNFRLSKDSDSTSRIRTHGVTFLPTPIFCGASLLPRCHPSSDLRHTSMRRLDGSSCWAAPRRTTSEPVMTIHRHGSMNARLLISRSRGSEARNFCGRNAEPWSCGSPAFTDRAEIHMTGSRTDASCSPRNS